MDQRRPHSPATYRRRRLAAALLGVFVLALVVWGANMLIGSFNDDSEPASATESAQQTQDDDAGSEPADEATEEPEATTDDAAESEPAAEATEEPDGTCAPGDVAVRAATNQESYGTGVAPLLILEVENTSSDDCTLDVGTAEQAFGVSHAGREIFNTAQCGAAGESLEIEFAPGQSERAHLVWPRSDSGVDCSEPSQVPTGDYELTVSVSGITSDPHTFHVTGVAE